MGRERPGGPRLQLRPQGAVCSEPDPRLRRPWLLWVRPAASPPLPPNVSLHESCCCAPARPLTAAGKGQRVRDLEPHKVSREAGRDLPGHRTHR